MYQTDARTTVARYRAHLVRQEKSDATIQKYIRDVSAFLRFTGTQPLTKELILGYKRSLQDRYAIRSVNSMLASLNHFLTFLGLGECRVRNLRFQQQTYCPPEKELRKEEYLRLLKAAERDPKLQLILQTICATGIRVSELRYFTLEAVTAGEIHVRCKSKTRTVLIPGKLRSRLLSFARSREIRTGAIFRCRSGAPLDRSTIWRKMKQLCAAAQVAPEKVFPHNLRKLFARTFYSLERDIAQLADILGHSSINTTRIYLVSTGSEHLRKLDRLDLLMSPENEKSHIIYILSQADQGNPMEFIRPSSRSYFIGG